VKFSDVVAQIETGIGQLPGSGAHDHLAPRPRRAWPEGFNRDRIRQAAGLILLFPADDTTHLVLTVRSHSVRHGGQVSLPGGVVDPGETYPQTALREAHEEIGLDGSGVRILGALTPIEIPVSGFRLHPIVGATDVRPGFKPSDEEVARILELDIDDLLAPTCLIETERQRDGRLFVVPGFHLAGVEIWGATAMVLAEFLTLLGWTGKLRS